MKAQFTLSIHDSQKTKQLLRDKIQGKIIS
jgi:hypothetical protein